MTAPSAAPASSPTGTCRRSTARSATAPRRSRTCRSTPAGSCCRTTAAGCSTWTATPLPGIYATGWVKRGPVGLIGHTKSDAAETVAHLLADAPDLSPAPQRDGAAVDALLAAKGLPVTDFDGWDRLDAHELAAGEPHGRARVKHISRHRDDGDRRPRLTRPPSATRADQLRQRGRTRRLWYHCQPPESIRAAYPRLRRRGWRRARRPVTLAGVRSAITACRRHGRRSKQWCTRSRVSFPAARTPRSS